MRIIVVIMIENASCIVFVITGINGNSYTYNLSIIFFIYYSCRNIAYWFYKSL